MVKRLTPTLKAVSDAVLAVAAELSVDEVLQRLVDGSRELAGARYAALGLPDGDGGFRRFLTSGMSDRLVASLGPLPRQHGVLGAMLETRSPYRTRDIHDHPRFRGWWPTGHPNMRSFLGVPIVAPDGVIGAFYLTEKIGAPDFSDEDEELIGLLAAHAAIAIANARLYEQTRELSIVAERNRLALDLHDAVSQKLFGLVLNAETAATLLERNPEAARDQVAKLRTQAREALDELRSLVFELRPPDLERDGLGGALRKHVELLRRLEPHEIELVVAEDLPVDPARDREILRIAQEALQNAVKHAHAHHVTVRLGADDGGVLLEVEDDGVGFDPAAPGARSRQLGLTSMEERAERLGGTLEIRSAHGAGTTVRLHTGRG
ncbi:MAG TPA: GAF domain-containing sensor histidine kinase [Gaiellaceae bacterium]|jgi:signal transduction histidine kinase|nr:GAF domain-containing sensor histidine kinase [Gaiellaceae bacterium]